MKNNGGGCKLCEAETIYHDSMCRKCASQTWNRAALKKIEMDFTSATEGNLEFFNLYASVYKTLWIKNSDLPVAKKFSKYLSKTPLPDIRSWEDIYKISTEVKIHYSGNSNHGCPFIRVGRVLESLGKIEPRSSSRVIRRNNLIEKIPMTIRPILLEFFNEVSLGHKSTSSALKILESVRQFFEFVGPQQIRVPQSEAERFINEKLKGYSSVHYTERVRSISRFYSWAKVKNLVETNPFDGMTHEQIIKNCPQCKKLKKFWISNNLCDDCYLDERHRLKLSGVTTGLKFEWDYNQYALELYLKYIHRYRVRKRHIDSAKLLISFLKHRELKPILSWTDVAKARAQFLKESNLRKVPAGGCVIEKISYVLQELGVLPIRKVDHGIYLKRFLETLDIKLLPLVKEYLDQLRRNRRTIQTRYGTARMIADYGQWLKTQNVTDLFLATRDLSHLYILSLETKDRSGVVRVCLGKFYRWCIFRKKAFINPFEGLEKAKLEPALEILCGGDIKKIEAFIKSPSSSPEQAFILCLIFYFNFTVKNIAYALVEITSEDRMKIILRRDEISYQCKRQKRHQIFSLPSEPQWVLDLEKRYLDLWRQRHKKIKQNFPTSPLVLRSDSRHGRNVRTLAIYEILADALESILGYKVPPALVRRTGAHIYTQQVGSSVLMSLGWSQDYAWDFVWRQRKLFRPQK